jgi:hypothetical protein
MEIVAMSVSWIEAFIAYGHSRFPVRLFFPLAFFISTAGQVGYPGIRPGNLMIVTLLAFGLLFQFRLWDDLSDQTQDRIDHPDRVLSKTKATTHFRCLLIVSRLFNFVLVLLFFGPSGQLLVFILLNGALLLWYQWLRGYWANPFLGYHIILLKYPTFVYLMNRNPSQSLGLHLFLSMALVYFCFCVYEVLHDKKLPLLKSTAKMLFIEMSALIFISAMMVIATPGRNDLTVFLQGALAVVGAFILATLFKRHQGQIDLKGLRYSVFVIVFLQILTFSFSEGL